ncbi:uncharacterized protein PAF06_012368 [Gastrophryne carolinensis]
MAEQRALKSDCLQRQASSASERALSYKRGQLIHGFRVNEVTPIPEFLLTAVKLIHENTGAQYLHLAREDSENLFNVQFQTIPKDSTGVSHILEHVVLCGSQKYPCRDPFFKMLNRSLSTFMNAFTASDYTMYPFSTQNSKDFQNLLSVYLDAVFFPLLKELDFWQEGWRLEHTNPNDSSSPFAFKGVVFNEVKGKYGNNEKLYEQQLQNKLLPDTTYAFISGGDPLYIPDLTWEQLKQFHATHYHPSNARFFTYGNFPLEQHLKQINEDALIKFGRIKPPTAIPSQKRWSKPREYNITCGVDPLAADPAKQTMVSISYLTSDITDSVEVFTLIVLSSLLTDGPNSPFYKALIEAKLGTDYSPDTGLTRSTKDTYFSIGLQGVAKEDVDKVKETITKTFGEVVEKGFDPERIEAFLHSVEIEMKDQSTQFGFLLSSYIASRWNNNVDPVKELQLGKRINNFRQRLKESPTFLQEKVKHYFQDNQHRMVLIMSPDEEYYNKQEQLAAEKLNQKVKALSEVDRKKIYEKGLELLRLQSEPQDASCLPALKVSDIDRTVPQTKVELAFAGDVPVQYCAQPTNGMVYFRALSSLNTLPEELKPYVPIFCSVITNMGSGPYNYREQAQQIDLNTGGMSASISIATDSSNLDSYEQGVLFSSSCLDRNTSNMMRLWTEIFNCPHFDNEERLQTLVKETAQNDSNGITDSAQDYAKIRASRTLTPSGELQELYRGMEKVTMMKKIAEMPNLQSVLQKISQIGKYILLSDNLRCSVNATPQQMSAAAKEVEKFLAGIRRSKKQHKAVFPHIVERSLASNTKLLTEYLSKEISKISLSLTSLEGRVNEVSAMQEAMEGEMHTIRNDSTMLASKIEYMENRDRRANLRFRGIPEQIEDVKPVITALYQELIPGIPLDRLEFDQIHRALGPRRPPEEPPRDVIVKFHFLTTKEAIQKAAREANTLMFQGHRYQGFVNQMSSVSIIPISWSDHDGTLLKLRSLLGKPTEHSWSLNTSLLAYPEVVSLISDSLTEYFELNDTLEVSASICWEAHKPTIRGKLIQIASQKKRERNFHFDRLYLEVAEKAKSQSTPSARSELHNISQELNLALAGKAEKVLRRIKHKFYCKANKPDTLLAKKLKTPEQVYCPIRLKDVRGEITSNPTIIVKIFRDQLQKLYTNPQTLSDVSLKQFFKDVSLPALLMPLQGTLEEEFNVEEVTKAIGGLKLNKRPGPDGFSAAYYKKFVNILAPKLTAHYNHIREGGSFSRESLMASISMIPKPETDTSIWSNFRPISLINLDVKILSKILADRLSAYLPGLIGNDQVGFIPGRQAGDNIRKLIQIAHIARKTDKQLFFLSLDIRKAFDSVSWKYLFSLSTLRQWGFGPKFIDDVLLTISNPLISLPNLLQLMGTFARVSGLQVNTAKSRALNINLAPETARQLQLDYDFQWENRAIKYLGVSITNSYDTLFAANFVPLQRKLFALLDKWGTYGLSWLGRIAVVKMTLLPKFLYLARALPVKIPLQYLKLLQDKIFNFIWCGRKARLAKSIMYKAKANGGLGVPNLSRYYKAAQLAQILAYHEKSDPPCWVAIEAEQCFPQKVENLLWLVPKFRILNHNPIMTHSLQIWDDHKFSCGLASPHLPLLPLWDNPMFPPACLDPARFRNWKEVGIYKVQDCFQGASISTFQQFRDKYDLSTKDFFGYLQLAHFLKEEGGRFRLHPLRRDAKKILEEPLNPSSPSTNEVSLKGSRKMVLVPNFKPSETKTHFSLPLSVNYVAKCVRAVPYTDPDYGSLLLLAEIMSAKFLHSEIREKGGAYGSGASTDSSGIFTFYSLRDPNSLVTLSIFDKAVDWAKSGKFTQQDIDEGKLSLFSSVDSPTAPSAKGKTLFLSGRSDEMRQKLRERIFAVSHADLVNAASKYLSVGQSTHGEAILGPENASIAKDPSWIQK